MQNKGNECKKAKSKRLKKSNDKIKKKLWIKLDEGKKEVKSST
jgi:hypothetical protein